MDGYRRDRRAGDGVATSVDPPSDEQKPLDDATRHLCAAIGLDSTFRYRVASDVYADRSRRLAPSYGFDLGPVLRHVRRAWLLDAAQYLAVVAILISGLWLNPRGVGLAVLAVVDGYIVVARVRLVFEWWRRGVRGASFQEVERYRYQRQWVRLGLLAAVIVTLGYLAVLQQSAAHLHGDASYRVTLMPVVGAASWTLAAVVGVVLLAEQVRQGAIDRLKRGARRGRPLNSRRARELSTDQHNKVTVYSRSYPFVGSGAHVRTWSFALRLVPALRKSEAQSEFDQPPFRTVDLVRRLKRMIADLVDEADDEYRLPGLTVEDRVFVEGTKAADVPELLTQADFRAVLADPSRPERHYLASQVVAWDGELVTTVYVHASVQGRTLYLEFSSWAIPPTLHAYRLADRRNGTGLPGHLVAFAKSLRTLPPSVVRLVPWLAVTIKCCYRRYLGPRDSYDARWRHVDVGSLVSVRELGGGLPTVDMNTTLAQTDVEYFQLRDIVKHVKVVEIRLLQTVLDFLEQRDVDTSEYRQRMTAILNNGVMMNFGSGTVTFTGSAIGENATVTNAAAPGDSQTQTTP